MGFLSRLFGKSAAKDKDKRYDSNTGDGNERIPTVPPKTILRSAEESAREANQQIAHDKDDRQELDKADHEPKSLPSWKPGDLILDLYEVKSVVSGGMGDVFIADHNKWNVKFAIKAPNQMILSDEEFLMRILREAKSWTEIGLHPNIAYCYFVKNLYEVPHIFIEYVDGGNLKNWIEDMRCAEMRTALDLAIQFCSGMAYAHNRGMVHRDIKPANILITKEGILKITDFGIAKVGDEKEPSNYRKFDTDDDSKTKGYIGTPEYSSPEQLMDAHNLGPETDIFSFGLCLWEMLCGIKPYAIASEKTEIPDPKAIRPDIPDDLAFLLRQVVAYERKERQEIGGFEALKKRLKAIYRGLFNEDSPHSSLETINLEADGLNNQGISFAELGKMEEAEACFRQALEREPLNPSAIFNLGLLEWRSGRIADDEVLRRLEVCLSASWIDEAFVRTLLAKVHAERLQPKQAREILKTYPGAFDKLFGKKRIQEIAWPNQIQISVKNDRAIRFTPDGQMLVTLGRTANETICFYDAGSFRQISCIKVDGANMKEMSLNMSGSRLLAGGGKQLILCNTEKRGISSVIELPQGEIQRLCVWDDGNTGIIQDKEQNINSWDLRTAKGSRMPFKADKFMGSKLEFAPNCLMALYTQPRANDYRIYRILQIEVMSGETVSVLEGHTGDINWIGYDDKGSHAISASDDRSIRLWDLNSSKRNKVLNGHVDEVLCANMDANIKWGISSSLDNTVRIWDLATGRCITSFQIGLFRSVFMSPDGTKALLSNSDRERFYYLNLSTLRNEDRYIADWEFAVPRNYAAIGNEIEKSRERMRQVDDLASRNRNKESYAVFDDYWKTKGYNISTELAERYRLFKEIGIQKKAVAVLPKLRLYADNQSVDSACFTPDGKCAVSGNRYGNLFLWDMKSGVRRASLEGHLMSVSVIRSNREGTKILSGSRDTHLRLWDIAKRDCVGLFRWHTDSIRDLQFNVNETLALSAASSGSYPGFEFAVWDLKSKKLIQSYKGDQDSFSSVAISPQSETAFCGTWNGMIKRWDFKTQKIISTAGGHKGSVSSIALSPEGKLVVTGGNDGTVRIWNSDSLSCIGCLKDEDHKGYVKTIDISPDGTKAACVAGPNISIWDLPQKSLINSFKHPGTINCVAFSPDGSSLLCAGSDGSIMQWYAIWDIDFPEPTDWDDRALPYLHHFIARTSGRYNEDDLNQLLDELSARRGLGWIRKDGIKARISELVKESPPEAIWSPVTASIPGDDKDDEIAPFKGEKRKAAVDKIIKNIKPIRFIDGIDLANPTEVAKYIAEGKKEKPAAISKLDAAKSIGAALDADRGINSFAGQRAKSDKDAGSNVAKTKDPIPREEKERLMARLGEPFKETDPKKRMEKMVAMSKEMVEYLTRLKEQGQLDKENSGPEKKDDEGK